MAFGRILLQMVVQTNGKLTSFMCATIRRSVLLKQSCHPQVFSSFVHHFPCMF